MGTQAGLSWVVLQILAGLVHASVASSEELDGSASEGWVTVSWEAFSLLPSSSLAWMCPQGRSKGPREPVEAV